VEVVRPIGKPRHPLVFFYSFRSPYSQLAVDRVYDIARHYGAYRSVPKGYRSVPKGYRSVPKGYRSVPKGYRSVPKGHRVYIWG
jgi:hypothetical protein